MLFPKTLARLGVVGFAGTLLLGATAPAFAGFGAIAYDTESGRRGWSFNFDNPRGAERKAMQECGPGCEIILRFGNRQCGALASTENNHGWGAAWRRSSREARDAAYENCQERNRSRCIIRMTECNE